MEGMLNCYQFKIIDGVPAFSNDGGATWTPVPAVNDGSSTYDPRNDAPLNPPRTGSNIPCLAAANAVACFVELHREIVKWYDDAVLIVLFCGAISAMLQLFFGVGWLTFQLSVNYMTYVNQILNYTGALTNASFTSTIQSELQCILYCRAASNGQWSANALELVLSDVAAKSGDMWRLIEIYLESIGGYVGLNNAGTTTSIASADCGGCGCGWCYKWDFAASQGSWTVDGDGYYSAGSGFIADSHSSIFWDVYAGIHSLGNIALTRVRFKANVGEISGSPAYYGNFGIYIKHGGVTTKVTSITPTPGAPVTIEWNGSYTNVTDVWMDWNVGNYDERGVSASVVCYEGLMEGPGANPFGADNCI